MRQVTETFRLERLATIITSLVAGVFVFVIPIGWYAINYTNTKEFLQDQAEVSAKVVSEVIYTLPEFWLYEEYRLQDVMARSQISPEKYHLTLVAADSGGFVTVGDKVEAPYIKAQAPLTDGERIVGSIKASTSLSPLIASTILVLVFGLSSGAGIVYLLKFMPFRALKSALEERDKALRKAHLRAWELHHLAMHDTLTGLPNRAFFLRKFTEQMTEVSPDSRLYLLIVDLDRFKEINDALGHQIGDELLKAIAERIFSSLEKSVFLARLGGDEFALLVDGQECDGKTLADRITEYLKAHVELEGYHIQANASIGIACFPKDADNVSELLRCADTAMYQAKTQGKPVHRFDGSTRGSSLGHLSLAADLRHALDTKALSLHYQPQFCLETAQVIGLEALVRWQHKEHGFVSPQLFVRIAEQSHMINDLTQWVLETALNQLSLWHKNNLNIRLSVNISAKNLQDDFFTETVLELVRKAAVDPEFLTLELTESSIIIDPEKAEERISNFVEAGLRISIDDYGTGYSSLAHLKRLTINELKIDKSFILNVDENEEDRTIVRSTIELAHSLGMSVVAEGIETQAVADLLNSYGCEVAQGYYYSRPLPPDELSVLLYGSATPEQKLVEAATNVVSG